MRRVMQSVRDGTLSLVDGPVPTISPTEVLVATRSSLISSGTERAVRRLAASSLVSKARARPDLVRQVVRRLRTDGAGATIGAIRDRLAEQMPLGYSASGEVLAVGEAVEVIRPGVRVATAGAGHAEIQVVAGTLVAELPDGVSYEEGAFATVAAVALNGLRLANIGPGAKVAVVGLGLVGQLACRLAVGTGAIVAATDVDDWKLQRASPGVHPFANDADGWRSLVHGTRGAGVDAVIVTASTTSSEPMNRAVAALRDHGTVVLVGDAGMDLDRRPLYEREATIRVARSYGPGRYDPVYEHAGVDYPIGEARWTAGRNIESVVELMASDRLQVADLVTHTFPFSQASEAYAVLGEGAEKSLGIILTYPPTTIPPPSPTKRPARSGGYPGSMSAGLIGAGHFAREVLLPAADAAGFGPWRSVASTGGSSAQSLAATWGFDRAVDPLDVVADPDASVVFIASDHDSHARYAIAALSAGKHVFCEKPLAIREEDLDAVEAAWRESAGTIMVGFNRRWSPLLRRAKASLRGGQLQIIYRINAGALPSGHWLNDRRQGGRLIGEACHFIDACNYLVGIHPIRVSATALGEQELLLDGNFSLLLSYPDGSQATIVYSAMAPSFGGKERVEILGHGRAVQIDDYHTIEFRDQARARRRRLRPADKGYRRELEVFAAVVRGGHDAEAIARSGFMTSRTAFAALHSLMTGEAVPIPQP
jgi:predicted dehydrogenase/threonine dehydrogenase-like Zn-dependent dehydrogenase